MEQMQGVDREAVQAAQAESNLTEREELEVAEITVEMDMEKKEEEAAAEMGIEDLNSQLDGECPE